MEFTWLKEYKRTWEDDEPGLIGEIERQNEPVHYLRPLLKQTVVITDYSKAMLKGDMGPPKHKILSHCMGNFISTYYIYNPLSALTLIVSKNSRAYIAEQSAFSPSPAGEFSLKNSLELALTVLTKKEPFWSREILVVHNALSTCDEGNLWDTIESARNLNVRISVISLSALVYAFHEATLSTGGEFKIVKHMSLLMGYLENFAQSGTRAKYASLIPVAFPTANERMVPCACHLKMVPGYICPICLSTLCSIPSECPICGYFLISTPHLAKAKLSLMPLQEFVKIEGSCVACHDPGSLACPDCQAIYCNACENFIRKNLGKCLICSLN